MLSLEYLTDWSIPVILLLVFQIVVVILVVQLATFVIKTQANVSANLEWQVVLVRSLYLPITSLHCTNTNTKWKKDILRRTLEFVMLTTKTFFPTTLGKDTLFSLLFYKEKFSKIYTSINLLYTEWFSSLLIQTRILLSEASGSHQKTRTTTSSISKCSSGIPHSQLLWQFQVKPVTYLNHLWWIQEDGMLV